MAEQMISPDLAEEMRAFLSKKRGIDLLTAYLFYMEKTLGIQPVVYPPGKVIFQSVDSAIGQLEKADKLWREAQITISFSQEDVNAETKRVYICPFSGKVFGNNTHPNPQDAIYDHVGHCPENKERASGLPVRRFYVSEDPDVIKNYITERKKPVTKTVYSSVVTGKLFNSRQAIIDDFKKNYLKPIPLNEVQTQNRFELDDAFLEFVQSQLADAKITAFVEGMAEYDDLTPYVQKWVEAEG